MSSFLGAVSGGLKGLSTGLGYFANLKLKEEDQQARLLQEQNLARFRSNLDTEKQKGLLDYRNSLNASNFVTQSGQEIPKGVAAKGLPEGAITKDVYATKVATDRQSSLMNAKASTKKDIKIKEIADIFDVAPDTANDIRNAISKNKLLATKDISSADKIAMWKMAQEASTAKGIPTESPNYFVKTKQEFDKLAKVFAPAGNKLDLSNIGKVDPNTGKKEYNVENVLLTIGTSSDPIGDARDFLNSKQVTQFPDIADAVRKFIKLNSKKNKGANIGFTEAMNSMNSTAAKKKAAAAEELKNVADSASLLKNMAVSKIKGLF